MGDDLWRLAKELRHSEFGGWLTLIASVWIIATASWSIVRRVCSWLPRRRSKDADWPEGA